VAKTRKAEGLLREIIALKKDRIFEAAVDLFYDHGYENTTLDAVADKLKVTKPFIYSYYDSKGQLLGEICQRGISASLAAIENILATPGTSLDRMRVFGKDFTTAVIDNQKYLTIFAREEKNLAPVDFRRISGMRRDFDFKLNKLLQQGIDEETFIIGDRELAALAIGGMVSWVYVWYRANGRLDRATLATRFTALILAVIGVDPEVAIEDRSTASKSVNAGRVNLAGARKRK
jgi:TetR/AcrR family transcriptional regulator, cholesterol catabolism regulator